MKQAIILSLFTVFILLSACNISNEITESQPFKAERTEVAETKIATEKMPVLVELFTSEGCSSCPPADLALAKLQNEQPVENTEIITLAFHVDYWDYLGWKDAFSSAKFSQRQGDYTRAFSSDSNYTPQMIVDGKYEFVGSKYSEALTKIGKAAENKKGSVEIALKQELLNTNLKVKISDINVNEDSNVWVAIAEDDLLTDVKRGENSGKKLSHTSVVRELQSIGEVKTGEKTFETEQSVKLNSSWKENKLSFVVFVQNKQSKNIVAVGKTMLK